MVEWFTMNQKTTATSLESGTPATGTGTPASVPAKQRRAAVRRRARSAITGAAAGAALCAFAVAPGLLGGGVAAAGNAVGAQPRGQAPTQARAQVQRIRIDRDNIEIRTSVIIEPGVYRVADADGNGVLQVRASGVTVEFAPGALLLGTADETATPDTYAGTGIRIENARNVTIVRPQIGGFKVGVHATNANGLTLTDGEFRDLWRHRLGSTPAREDSRDWLWPHRNDANEWLNNYGAAIYIEDSAEVEIARTRVRDGQNGIIFDNVEHGRVYDNDASFLSGWGLALWRSSFNVITRNAFDFCIRGYSHGVYNRGQDSAGILAFEQCSNNIIAENSATHGGDGFFGFGGREALGELWLEQERARLRQELGREDVDSEIKVTGEVIEQFRRRGCNDNLLINNDFSYAAAHGIEMTFSFGNQFLGNRLVENAICGVWGGYSQDTLIAANDFAGNGEGAYGLERGGVNIEHGFQNKIAQNTFRDNKCGVHLWWDPDTGLLSLPWAKANHRGSTDNLIVNNSFEGDKVAVHLRATKNTTLAGNMMTAVETELDADDASPLVEGEAPPPNFVLPRNYAVYGETQPVGARSQLQGRHNIIMTEWGPWDHTSPLIRREPNAKDAAGRTDRWVLYKAGPVQQVRVLSTANPLPGGPERRITITAEDRDNADRSVVVVSAPEAPGVYPYQVEIVTADGAAYPVSGQFINAQWDARFFAWTDDPREHADAWTRMAQEKSTAVQLDHLRLVYGWGGPSSLKINEALTAAGIGNDRFGMIATTSIPLGPGVWRISTLSDDGVRVTVDGDRIIDNWTHHGPTRDSATFLVASGEKPVSITLEHFEIDGYSVLEFELEPVETVDTNEAFSTAD